MPALSTYRIEVYSLVDEADLNAASPVKLTIQEKRMDTTLLSIQTDQSGMVGAIRHLHGLGIVLRSIIWMPGNPPEAEQSQNKTGACFPDYDL